MGTIADKLTYLNGTKQAIKQAINEDFEVIDNNTTFREYADEISSNNAKYKDLIPKETKSATNSVDISNSSGLDKALVTQYGNTKQSILPSEYTQVDYIESSGTQYIDTGFKPNQNTRMTAKVYINGLVGQYDNIGGARNGNTNQFHIIIVNDRFDARYGTQDSNISYTTTGLFNFDFNKNKIYINNSLAKTFTDTTFSSDYNAYIFAVNNTGSATQKANYKLYNMKWYDNNTLVRDFIPCYRNSDNEVGLYDLVNDVFYTNLGTGVFTYGSKTPTPDTPQEIVNISGKSTLKDVGKNLFDISKVERNVYYNYGTTGSVPTIATSDKRITLSPTNSIKVKPSTQYTLSFPSAFRYAIAEMENNYISLGDSGWKTNTTYTFTTSATTNYIGFNFSKTDNSTITDNDWNTFINSGIQLEENSTASTYEPYQEQNYTINLDSIELCKIGTYKDRIYYSSGKWYLEKKIGKFIFNGSENWLLYLKTFYLDNLGTGKPNSLCSSFSDKGTTWTSSDENNRGKYTMTNQTNQFKCMPLTDMTLEEFKTWLSTNNITVYYTLPTPTTTEITESNYPTLYNQLNNIKLYKGVNHITMTNESGLDVEFDIEYYKDWKLD